MCVSGAGAVINCVTEGARDCASENIYGLACDLIIKAQGLNNINRLRRVFVCFWLVSIGSY